MDFLFVLSTALALAALVVALPFFLAPASVRARLWISAWPRITRHDDPSPGARAFFTEARRDLQPLGFRPAGAFLVRGYMAGQSVEVEIHEHESGRQTAAASLLHQERAGGDEQTVRVLSLSSRFPGEREVTTGNAALVSFAPPGRNRREIRLPGATGAAVMLAVHRRELASFAPGEEPLGFGGDSADGLRDSLLRQVEAYSRSGYFALDADSQRYRPTWRGAVLLSWLHLWPVRPIYRALTLYRAAEKIRQSVDE